MANERQVEREEGWERGHLSLETNEWLSLVATGKLDVMDLVRGELANRGCDISGKWVGFREAERLMRETAPPPNTQGSQDSAPVRRDESRPDVAILADAFESNLESRLGKTKMEALRKDMLAWRGRPECPSQDRLDANEVMIDAFEESFGREPDLESDEDCTVVDQAWSLAREHMAIKATALERAREGVLAMGFDTDETRNSDSLDFQDVAVWSARKACASAWLDGRADGIEAMARENSRLRGENAGLNQFHERVTSILQGAGFASVADLAEAFVDVVERQAKTEAALDAAKKREKIAVGRAQG